MTGRRLDRAALVLGVAAVLSCVFALTTGGAAPVDLVHVGGPEVVVLLVLGVVAAIGGATHRLLLAGVAGAGLVMAAVLQLAQLGRHTNWLGGNGSTMSLMGGLGLGLLAVTLTKRSIPSDTVQTALEYAKAGTDSPGESASPGHPRQHVEQ